MLPANLEREIEAATLIRNLQGRVRRLETLENQEATGCLTLLEDIKLTSPATTVTFSSISQAHRHLWLLINAGLDPGSGAANVMQMIYNADSGVNYRYYWIRHVGVANVSGGGTASINYIELTAIGVDSSGAQPNVGGLEVNIYDYTSTAKQKPCTWKAWSYVTAPGGGEGPGATIFASMGGGHWQTAASAITSIALSLGAGGGDFEIGSQFTLYGLC